MHVCECVPERRRTARKLAGNRSCVDPDFYPFSVAGGKLKGCKGGNCKWSTVPTGCLSIELPRWHWPPPLSAARIQNFSFFLLQLILILTALGVYVLYLIFTANKIMEARHPHINFNLLPIGKSTKLKRVFLLIATGPQHRGLFLLHNIYIYIFYKFHLWISAKNMNYPIQTASRLGIFKVNSKWSVSL